MSLQFLRHQYYVARETWNQPWPRVIRDVKAQAKSAVVDPLESVRHKLTAVYGRKVLRERGITEFPPPDLRERVNGSPREDIFLNIGRLTVKDLRAALAKQGRQLESFQSVLDFGCGSGRTLIWLDPNHHRLYGTDIDAEAIRWCAHGLPRMTFETNEALPPLRYEGSKFDLIYAISVFTHLSEDYQFTWLKELARITKPGGMLLLTVHGDFISSHSLPADLLEKRRREGFVFLANDYWKGKFPDWYQTAYHTKEYVRREWAKFFDVVDYVDRGVNRHQDLVVLKAR